jgi:hypothetical protein
MRKWQAIPVAIVAALLAGAALFTSAAPVVTHAAVAQPNLSLVCQVSASCTFASAPAGGIDVDVVLTNQSGAPITVAAFAFDLYNSAAAFLTPSLPVGNTGFLLDAGWSSACALALVPAVADLGNYTSTGGTASQITCFTNGSETVADGASPTLATVHFAVSGNNSANLRLNNATVSDANQVLLIGCSANEIPPTPPAIYAAGPGSCTGATVSVGSSQPTNTPQPTATPTATPVPTGTPCVAHCPTPTSLAFKTITPNAGTQTATAPTKVPATAAPGGTTPPPPPATGAGGSKPVGNTGGAAAGGSRPVHLPDAGVGANNGIDWMAAALLSLLAVAIGGATGVLYFGAAHVSASRRGRGQ